MGQRGYIARFDGHTLDRRSSDVANGTNLRGVWASGAKDVWAVSDDGHVLHWDGRAISAELETTEPLFFIWGSGPHDIWAVGGSTHAGTNMRVVLHGDGQRWVPFLQEFGGRLLAVWGSSATDVWMAGEGGGMLHWDGTNLTPISMGMTFDLVWLSGSAPDNVWALRYAAAPLHFDGVTWSEVMVDSKAALTTIWSGGPGDVWLGGQGGFLGHFDGAAWKREPDYTEVGGDFYSLSGGPSDLWTTMNYAAMDPTREVVLHYDGTRWAPPGLGMVWRVYDIYAASSGVWTAGGGSALIQLR